MIAIMIVGSFSDMCQSVRGPTRCRRTAGDPFSRIQESLDVSVLTNKRAASATSSFGSMRSWSASNGKWVRQLATTASACAVSLDRLTVGAPRQPEFMNGPHSGIRRHDANRLSLLVNCHRVERWGILNPVEPFDLHFQRPFAKSGAAPVFCRETERRVSPSPKHKSLEAPSE
jgi:hypothetical protein